MIRMKRKLGSKGQVVVPKEIREKLGLTEGSMLTFEISGGSMLVRPEPSPEEVVERFLSVKGRKRASSSIGNPSWTTNTRFRVDNVRRRGRVPPAVAP